MCIICTWQPQIGFFSTQMTLIPSNVNNWTQQLQIRCLTTQMTFNTLKFTQMHSTNSNHHSNASNMHPSITNIQINLTTSKYAIGHLLQTFEPPSTNRCSKCAPMHLQHEALQKLFRALKPLKILSLTN